MNKDHTIALYQPILQRVAVNILGSVADAEDMVQDTLLKWLTIDTEKINNTKAYLLKSVTNNCINHLQAIKRKKDECIDSIKPQELIDKYKESELFNFDFDNEITSALTIIHKKLEPLEKGIFVLREFFGVEYEELQDVFNKKRDNCRQLFSRAKSKLNQETVKIKSELSKTGFFESFKLSCLKGDPQAFISHIQTEIKK